MELAISFHVLFVVSMHTRIMSLICMGIDGTGNYRCITRITICTPWFSGTRIGLEFSMLVRMEGTGRGCFTTMFVFKGGRGKQAAWSLGDFIG
jgi:hypothetical protein